MLTDKKTLRMVLPSVLLLPVAVALLQGCGTPVARKLLSVTISPSSAGASGYPSGEVPFTATGHYNTAPYDVTPLQTSWGAYATPAKIASVTQSGLATCNSGASGTTIIEAWVTVIGPVCNVIDPAGRPCGTVGASAKLTCP